MLNISKLWNGKNLTQEQLAKLTAAKRPSIARIESGRQNPSLRLLEKTAEALDAKLDIRFIPKAS